MRPPLTLAVAQPVTIPYDVGANAQEHAAAVREAAARVVVFPELSLSGYELDAALLDPTDPRLSPLVEACAETGTIALAGAPVTGAHIAMLAVDGGGARVAYEKTWPHEATEGQRFAAGPGPVVITVDGWRLGLAICRDTGIVRHVEATVALGIDVFVAGTAICADETDAQDERASRIAGDQGVWAAFASFAGPTAHAYERTAGCSGIWAPDGTLATQVDARPGQVARTICH